ncbi:hypothetical protein TIFTF001_036110 [Ficus carica]|uniref:Uncharacterized protein n=1 Tax=Ficus carica TaxID=3494 RepID=A0AA88E4M2_FICCA|nr:hypothetical protein TIFTF001_036110 [Ficus carica]
MESSATLIRACDVVDAGEIVMLWMPARGPGSPPNLTAPRTTHAALRPGSQRRWPPRSSVVGRAYVRLCRSYPLPLVAASRLPGRHVDVNADVVLADGANGADDAGPSIGSQQDASTSGAMNQRREVLADEMWDIYQRFPLYKST